MELVRHVAQALAPPPADRRPLLRRQRLGHERVVVDRRDVAAHRPQERRVGARRQQDAPGADRALGREYTDAGAVVLDRRRRGVLVDADAGREGRLPEARGELARVDERRVGPVPDAAEVGRRGDLGADRGLVEDLVLVAMAGEQLGRLLDPLELVRLERDAEIAGQLEVAVDAEAADVRDEAVEVLVAQPLELRQLVGEAGEAVLEPVRERADREATVPPARAEPDCLGLEEDDVARGVVAFGVQRRPEPGEAAADDAEIGLGVAFERRLGLARRQCVEPVRAQGRIGEGRMLRLGRRGVGPRERHGRESKEKRGAAGGLRKQPALAGPEDVLEEILHRRDDLGDDRAGHVLDRCR